jgi:hypothetical protein
MFADAPEWVTNGVLLRNPAENDAPINFIIAYVAAHFRNSGRRRVVAECPLPSLDDLSLYFDSADSIQSRRSSGPEIVSELSSNLPPATILDIGDKRNYTDIRDRIDFST